MSIDAKCILLSKWENFSPNVNQIKSFLQFLNHSTLLIPKRCCTQFQSPPSTLMSHSYVHTFCVHLHTQLSIKKISFSLRLVMFIQNKVWKFTINNSYCYSSSKNYSRYSSGLIYNGNILWVVCAMVEITIVITFYFNHIFQIRCQKRFL